MKKRGYLLLLIPVLFVLSCKKADDVSANLQGTWNRVVFDHNGTETWTFAADQIYVILNIPQLGIDNDTVSTGTFTTGVVRYSHGTLFNKNIFSVATLTISDFDNFKYNNGQQNIWYPAYNTIWEVHKLDDKTLILTTDEYNATPGGLEIREFYKE